MNVVVNGPGSPRLVAAVSAVWTASDTLTGQDVGDLRAMVSWPSWADGGRARRHAVIELADDAVFSVTCSGA